MTDDSKPTAPELVEAVGHPGELWLALRDRIQADAVKSFAVVVDEWLSLMWSLDAFRSAGVKPPAIEDSDAMNRGKGHWFAEAVALILQNRTAQPIGSRTNIQGFSQTHQIDVAWPDRNFDPLVCIETKVMGNSATATLPPRRATSDWSNRRREIKFAATDLKLQRRRQDTQIDHWDEWREDAPPKTYFLWAARLEPGKDSIEKMLDELRILTDTYLEGAGLIAWTPNPTGEGYEQVVIPASQRKRALDDVLHRVSNKIGQLAPDVTGGPSDGS